MKKNIKFSRRKFTKYMAKSGVAIAALTSAPMLNHNFLYNSVEFYGILQDSIEFYRIL